MSTTHGHQTHGHQGQEGHSADADADAEDIGHRHSSPTPTPTPTPTHSPTHSTSTTQAQTPLPLLKLFVASSMVFCNTFMMTSLMPFLTFLIDDMKVAPSPEDIGRYSGYLVSSFMFGQLLFSYMWGYLSDSYGRRPVMLVGLSLTGISFLMFGFILDYKTALVVRFLTGAFNGIIGATKTYLSEITDESNQARGFAVFGVARGLGMVIGPIVGGFLCLPAEKYPQWVPKGSLFDRFPYALPCVIGFLVASAGSVLGFFVLQETNARIVSNSNSNSNSRDANSRDVSHQFVSTSDSNANANADHSDADEETEPLLPTSTSSTLTFCNANPASDIAKNTAKNTANNTATNNASNTTNYANNKPPQPKTMREMFGSRKVIVSLLLYTLVSFTYIQYDELFALWSRLPFEEGGLEFQSSDMGQAYSIGGLSLFFYQVFLFSPIERRLGTLRTFQSGLLASLPAFLLLPLAALVRAHPAAMWCVIGISQVLRACAGVQAFTAVFLMISNSITAESRGSLNGIAQTLGSLGRMCGPVFAGILFSWSLENGWGFPLDYHFVFCVLGGVVAVIFGVSLGLDRSIDVREVADEVLLTRDVRDVRARDGTPRNP